MDKSLAKTKRITSNLQLKLASKIIEIILKELYFKVSHWCALLLAFRYFFIFDLLDRQ